MISYLLFIGRMKKMKTCYLIMSHKEPEQIYRLIHTIKASSPNCCIIVSHDSTNCSLDISDFEQQSGIYFQFTKGERGDFSLISKCFSAINYLLSNNIDFDWLITLSGQDYPTQPLSELELLLSTTQYDGFLRFFPAFSPESPWDIRESYQRYLYQYKKISLSLPKWMVSAIKPLKLVNYLQPFIRVHFSYGLRIGIKGKSIFNDNFNCYGGSFFSILSKKCVEYLNDFYHKNALVVEYYKCVLIADESFIQTALVNSKKFTFYNECKHYFDFSHTSHGHPAILTAKDYDAMTQSNYYFARKFDIKVDSQILDTLDEKIFADVASVALHN